MRRKTSKWGLVLLTLCKIYRLDLRSSAEDLEHDQNFVAIGCRCKTSGGHGSEAYEVNMQQLAGSWMG